MIRKSLYLLFSLLTFYLAGRYRAGALMLLFCVEMLLFLIMFAVSVYAKRNLDVEIHIGQSEIRKGEAAQGWLAVSNRGRLPVLGFRAQLLYSHSELSRKGSEWLRSYVPARGTARVAFRMESHFCGMMVLQLGKVEISDYLSLFKRKKKCNCRAEILVLPTGNSLQIDLQAYSIFSVLPEQELPVSPGGEPPEIFQIQPYQPGDSMKDIHWKLSARNDQLLSKKYTEEQGWEAAVYLNLFTRKGISIRKLDAFLELSSAVSMGLLKGNHPHRICWYDARRNTTAVYQVETQEAYQSMIRELVRLLHCERSEADETVYAEALHRDQRDGEIYLTVNMELELLFGNALAFRLSEDDYMREIAERSITG